MTDQSSQDRLNNIAQRANNKTHDPFYSKFIRWASLVLPIIAVIILTMVFTWSSLTKDVIIPLEEGELSVESIGRNELINPRFESRNEKGHPYVITAARALQDKENEDLVLLEKPFGEMALRPEEIIALSSKQGAYKQKQQRLLLKGKVKIAYSEGTTLDTEELHIDLKESKSWSDTDVITENQDGTITAKGLRADQNTETIKFIGPAKMVLNNSDLDQLFKAPLDEEQTP